MDIVDRWYSLRGWTIIGAAIGALIPVAATVYYIGLGGNAGLELLLIWPTSLSLMAAETATGLIANAIIWIIAAGPNVALYALVAAILYKVHRFLIEHLK